jgi:hypothetical protein
MKHIKKFNESNLPQYAKGEILVFSDENPDFVENLCKKLGYIFIGTCEIGEGCYVIKTDIGKEVETGKIFVEEYPEFFSSYERRDLRDENLFGGIKKTQYLISDLESMVGTKFINQNEWNKKIDEIISSLNTMKV